MGEGMENDKALMPFIHAANIACGYHAGDVSTMKQTIEWALQYGVSVGAHPSFHDREHFGRKERVVDPGEVYECVTQQLLILREITDLLHTNIRHVKPHGALYNMAARDEVLAGSLVSAVRDFDPSLVFYGLSGSVAVTTARSAGLATASEVFADRTYRDDGSLTPRSEPGALISDTEQALKQVQQIRQTGTVTTLSGNIIPVEADTVCIHGDGPQALAFAKAIHEVLEK